MSSQEDHEPFSKGSQRLPDDSQSLLKSFYLVPKSFPKKPQSMLRSFLKNLYYVAI